MHEFTINIFEIILDLLQRNQINPPIFLMVYNEGVVYTESVYRWNRLRQKPKITSRYILLTFPTF